MVHVDFSPCPDIFVYLHEVTFYGSQVNVTLIAYMPSERERTVVYNRVVVGLIHVVTRRNPPSR